jgi:superfamily II DNA or RNA helicase
MRQRILVEQSIRRVFVVVPTTPLKTHWVHTASSYGVELDHDFSNASPFIKWKGAVVTYAQVASLPEIYRRLSAEVPTLVILDEPHHCGDEQSWGISVQHAFEPSREKLLLSGTPFRKRGGLIPFTQYEPDPVDSNKLVCKPFYAYGYERALKDHVCRTVEFHRWDGNMTWHFRGVTRSATFDDFVGTDPDKNRRLNTAIDPGSEYLRTVLERAWSQLTELREDVEPDAGMLIVCKDQTHARQVGELVNKVSRETPILAISDDPEADDHIERFRKGQQPVLVAVNKVSEGIDIPRLRVGVWATNVTSELYFRQVVGRFVRIRSDIDDEAQYAILHVPDDDRLAEMAARVLTEIVHEVDLAAKQTIEQIPLDMFQLPEASDYAPVRAEATPDGTTEQGEDFRQMEIDQALAYMRVEGLRGNASAVARLFRRIEAKEGATVVIAAPPTTPNAVLHKRLRDANNAAAKSIGYHCGVQYSVVQGKLNRWVGADSVTKASIPQLQERLKLARQWLEARKEPRS